MVTIRKVPAVLLTAGALIGVDRGLRRTQGGQGLALKGDGRAEDRALVAVAMAGPVADLGAVIVVVELNGELVEDGLVAADAGAGAKAQGLTTAFVRRPGTALYPNLDRPDYVVDSLGDLAARVAGMKSLRT